eukprot:SAG31_NODE_5169_length_2702_cov_1.711103_3_plen_204_part_00
MPRPKQGAQQIFRLSGPCLPTPGAARCASAAGLGGRRLQDADGSQTGARRGWGRSSTNLAAEGLLGRRLFGVDHCAVCQQEARSGTHLARGGCTQHPRATIRVVVARGAAARLGQPIQHRSRPLARPFADSISPRHDRIARRLGGNEWMGRGWWGWCVNILAQRHVHTAVDGDVAPVGGVREFEGGHCMAGQQDTPGGDTLLR